MEEELAITKKMMRTSQSGGVASIREQWSKKGDDNGDTKSSSRRPLDVDVAIKKTGSVSVRDRWKKMDGKEDEAPATPVEKPRRMVKEDDFQSVLKRLNPNFPTGKIGKDGKASEKISVDLDFEEDDAKKEERRKEREAILKKIEEDSERRRKAEQEESRKRQEAEKKRREMLRKKHEDDAKLGYVNSNSEPKRNFVIPKRSHDQVSNIIKAKEENTKSKAELALEKKQVLAKRIEPLEIDDLDYEGLIEKATELYDMIYELESEKIDFQKKVERQQYDIMELKERASQMEISTIPSPKPVVLPLKTGLGVGKLSEKFSSNAPPKVQVSSPLALQNDPYTRLNDGKSFTDKFKMFETMAKK